MLVPLPAPLDVDAIELPCRDPDSVPHWERQAQASDSPAAPVRPGSSAGKLVVHKTEKVRNMEAEARKKRLDDAAAAGAGGEEARRPAPPRSCLPPAQDRKKAPRADVFQIAEAEEAPAAAAAPAQ